MKWFAVVLALTSAGALTLTAHAAEPTAASRAQEQRAAALTRTIKSPFCPGRTLDACSSPGAAVWRGEIRQWVSEEVPSGEIRRRLDSRASDSLRATPSSDTSAWLLGGSAAASLLLLMLAARKLTARHSQPADGDPPARPPAPPGADEATLDAKLDEELALLES